jgi:hypothetical protein
MLKAKRPTNDCMEAVVVRRVKKYREAGVDALLNEVLHEGTRDSQRFLWNPTVTRLVTNQLEKQGIPLSNFTRLYALRSKALRRFKESVGPPIRIACFKALLTVPSEWGLMEDRLRASPGETIFSNRGIQYRRIHRFAVQGFHSELVTCTIQQNEFIILVGSHWVITRSERPLNPSQACRFLYRKQSYCATGPEVQRIRSVTRSTLRFSRSI